MYSCVVPYFKAPPSAVPRRNQTRLLTTSFDAYEVYECIHMCASRKINSVRRTPRDRPEQERRTRRSSSCIIHFDSFLRMYVSPTGKKALQSVVRLASEPHGGRAINICMCVFSPVTYNECSTRSEEFAGRASMSASSYDVPTSWRAMTVRLHLDYTQDLSRFISSC